MKNIIFISILFFVQANFLFSQSLNWNTIEKSGGAQVYLNFGYDFGVTTQVGYAYKLNTKKPIVLMTDFSVPMGDQFDDYKFRFGGQMGILQRGSFRSSVAYWSTLRRLETNLVRQLGIGQRLALTTGIYKEKWHVAIDIAYDASVVNNLKHSEEMRSNFSEINDAWYVGTGGQWHYGIETSRKIGERMELNMALGGTNARGTDADALLPMYFKLGGVFYLNRTEG